jgi:type VI secretion system protein ImpE
MNLPESARVSTAERLHAAEEAVRRGPAIANNRWVLFQWLCIGRQWTRAVQQLQAWAKLAPGQTGMAQACRDLIRAERWREKTLAGQTPPGHVLDVPPQWMLGLYSALEMAGRGQIEASDAKREASLDQAPLVSGRSASGVSFEWIADSDSRLGPVCEVIVSGAYRWLSIADIARWKILPPAAPLELVWAPCEIALAGGGMLRGFMPSRYPGEGACDEPCAGHEREELLMGYQTVWREVGRTGVIGVGRKTWVTDVGEFSLFDLGECGFGSEPAGSGATGVKV